MDTIVNGTPTNPPQRKIVLLFGLIMIVLNGLCALYILCRTLCRWFVTKKSLPMALRVPFYIALTDFMLFSINFPNMLHPNLYGNTWPIIPCKIVGGLTTFAISQNISLVGSLALLTYLRICRKMYIDLGRFDYKLIIFILLTSLTVSLISIPSYGAGKYWCFTNTQSIRILPIVTLILTGTALTITIFSYSFTLREINSVNFKNEHSKPNKESKESMGGEGSENGIRNGNGNDSSILNSNNGILNRTRSMLSRSYYNGNNNDKDGKQNVRKIEPIVVRKIIGYVLIFIIQWTPPMIYVVGQIIGYDPMWVYLITDATVNIGGIGNMIQFIINEGWRDNYSPPSSEDSSTNSSFIGISLEPMVPSAPLHLIPRIVTSSEPNFEIMIKIDTNTNLNFNDYIFDNGKLRPLSSASSSTKVSNNNDFEYYTNNEETSTIVENYDSSSEVNLINNKYNTP